MITYQTPPQKDSELIDKVAQVLGTLDDFTLEVIGASSTRAYEVLFAAATKAARARFAEHAHRDELATIEREIEQAKGRLSDLESELAAIHKDRSGDDWSREQRVNKVRAERCDVRQRLQDLEKALRERTRAYS